MKIFMVAGWRDGMNNCGGMRDKPMLDPQSYG